MEDKIKNNLKTAILLGSFAFGIMSFILPIYSKRIGADAVSIGGLFSVFSVVTLLLRPLIGKGIDKYGGKKFLTSSFLFYAISMVLYSYSANIILLYLSRVIQGIGSSLMWVSAYSMAVENTENENRGGSIGKIDEASSRGALYGAVIGFIVLSNFSFLSGWSLLFKGYAVLSILAAFIVYKYIPETKTTNKEKQEIGDTKLAGSFFKLLAVVFISSISASMLNPLILIYLQDKFTKDLTVLAIAYIPTALVYSFLPSKLGKISDKIGRIIPMIIGLAGSGIDSFGFVYSSSIKVLVVFWVIESLGMVMASPAQEALVADLTGEDVRGTGYGLYLFVTSLGAAIGPLLGGYLYEYFGHTIPFFLNGIILLLDMILVIILFKNSKKV
ncbi:MAG: MFS transporter [Clostridiaceae bacterium]